MGYENLSEEAIAKLSSCETPEELLETASELGVKFTKEELAMITGGSDARRFDKEDLTRVLLGNADERKGRNFICSEEGGIGRNFFRAEDEGIGRNFFRAEDKN